MLAGADREENPVAQAPRRGGRRRSSSPDGEDASLGGGRQVYIADSYVPTLFRALASVVSAPILSSRFFAVLFTRS